MIPDMECLSTEETKRRAKQVSENRSEWRSGKCWTNETFIAAASFIHGGFYSYEKTEFVRVLDKVIITCPEHGDFEQRANNHLGGFGCVQCGYEQKAKTNLERYGAECTLLNKDVQKKIKKTNLERYGVESVLSSKIIREKSKQTNLERYGVEYPTQSEEIQDKVKTTLIERYGVESALSSKIIREKSKQTNLERYGVEYPMQSQEVQSKMKTTNLERYGVEYPLQSQEIHTKMKTTNLERYGVAWYQQSREHQERLPEIQEKANATKRENGTFSTSKIESDFIAKTGFVSQYTDERYPFACDAYDPERDLFIEINAHWTHGGHWFDSESEDDRAALAVLQEQAKTSEYYAKALNVWTERDPKKREIAAANKLNYVVLWDQADVDAWFVAGCPVRHDWAD